MFPTKKKEKKVIEADLDTQRKKSSLLSSLYLLSSPHQPCWLETRQRHSFSSFFQDTGSLSLGLREYRFHCYFFSDRSCPTRHISSISNRIRPIPHQQDEWRKHVGRENRPRWKAIRRCERRWQSRLRKHLFRVSYLERIFAVLAAGIDVQGRIDQISEKPNSPQEETRNSNHRAKQCEHELMSKRRSKTTFDTVADFFTSLSPSKCAIKSMTTNQNTPPCSTRVINERFNSRNSNKNSMSVSALSVSVVRKSSVFH